MTHHHRHLYSLSRDLPYLRALLVVLIAVWIGGGLRTSRADEIEVTILHTNDLHQNLRPLARIAGYVAGYKRTHPHTVFIDAGDWFDRGSSLVTMTRGEAIYGAMAAMPYDFWIVGNHDWAYGGPRLLELMRRYPTPVLATNLATTRPPLPSHLVRTLVKEFDGIRVGFFGITLDTYGKNPKARPDLYVLDCRKETAEAISRLKKMNVDIIVAVTHLGFQKMPHEVGRSHHPSDIDLAKEFPDIDVIIGGHSHTRLEEPAIRKTYRQTGTIITQAGALGQYLGRLTLTVDRQRRTIGTFDVELLPVSAAMPEHAATADFIQKQYAKHMPNATRTVGELPQPFEFHNLAYWYADFLRDLADTDLSLLSRKALYDEPKSFPAGPLDVEKLCGYFYDRYVLTATVDGGDLLDYCKDRRRRHRFHPLHHQGRPFSGDAIFFSGFDASFDETTREVRFSIDANRRYTIAIAWPFTHRDTARYRHQLPPRDALANIDPVPGLKLSGLRILPVTSRQALIREGTERGLKFYRKFARPRKDWEAWSKHFESQLETKSTSARSRRQPRRPNVVLIMTDDQGYGDLHLHGNSKIDTPTLDRLALESTRMDRFFVSPLCSFTRASLMTGRYYLRTGCASVTRGIETVRSEETTIAEVFRQAGYATGCFGKWHIGEHYPSHPKGQGFDEFLGMPQGHWDNYFDPVLEHNGRMVKTKGYITDVLTSAAIRFIKENRERPFFCYVPYNAPHTPMQVPDRYFDKYKSRGLDDRNAAIYGMVENIDENVARILKTLDELELAKNTIVVFLSDNGAEGPQGSRYNAGMRGMKGSVHEGGMRVPCFIRWPEKIAAGRVADSIAAHIDLLPTLAELCGIPADTTEPLDGISLAPLLLGKRQPELARRMIFHRSPGWRRLVAYQAPVITDLQPLAGAVRTQRWRAVNEGNGWQLYDMRADPSQTKDVADQHTEVVERLGKAYQDWFGDVTREPIRRPRIRVGFREWPTEKLTIPEAYFTGSIRWYNRWGFAHDWLTDWKSADDTIWWEIDVVEAGRFTVRLVYACDEESVGTVLQADAGGDATKARIERAHPPRPRLRPTRSKKVRYIQTFDTMSLGELTLPQGQTRITLRALKAPGSRICDVHSIVLQRLPDEGCKKHRSP